MAEFAPLAFYFDPATTRIDWASPQSLVAVNPEWLRRDAASIEASRAALPTLERHIWVATSGSGSTVPGRIRWVGLSKDAFLASAAAVNRHLDASAADVWAHALPVFHVGGLGILARAAVSGGSVAPAVAGRWDARRFHERLAETRATLTALVPSQVHDLVGARLRAPSALRAVVVGGARLDPELCAEARSLGWPCLPSYGLTETCSQVATAALASSLSTACAVPLPVLGHAAIRADEEQRLHIRAASLLTCYGEMTATGFRVWDPKREGWLPTDDLGRVTSAGVEVLGRASDTVKVLGEMVSLLRVEEVVRRWRDSLASTPAPPADVAVVALPHERLGHEIVVAAAPRENDAPSRVTLLASLLDFTSETLLPYEQPRRIAWVDRIPRTALGKCQRALLGGEVALQPRPDR